MTEFGRRDFLRAAALATASSAMGLPLSAQDSKPNIVFILIDDLGWSDLGCYGNKFHETPRIDQLAREGMRFTDAYAACPVCSPTRASIMSGQYPARLGITDFIPGHWRPYEQLTVPTNRTQHLPLEIETIAERLASAGYATGGFGKWHLGGAEHGPAKQGFDDSVITAGRHFGFNTHPHDDVPEGQYLAEYLTDRAVDFMEAHQDGPFFLYLPHYAVHIPLEAEDELIKKYEKKTKPASGVNHPVYAAMMEHVDNSVGRVLDKMDELGVADNTMVIFYSDNGGLRRHYQKIGDIVTTNAPLRDEKGSLYEGGIRVPLIVRWPGHVEAGSVCDVPVTSPDFYPTLLAAANAPAPNNHALDGANLVSLLEDKSAPERDSIYWHYPHYHHSRPAGAIRSGDWKLIEFYDDDSLELYNLAKDIGETTNLADEQPERAANMRARLAQWRESVNAPMPKPNPNYNANRSHEWGRHPGRS